LHCQAVGYFDYLTAFSTIVYIQVWLKNNAEIALYRPVKNFDSVKVEAGTKDIWRFSQETKKSAARARADGVL